MKAQQLATYAKQHHACKPSLRKILESKSETELINLYKENIDFCLENNFPSKDYLKENAGPILKHHGIFIDKEAICINEPFNVFLGTSKASISIDGYNVSQIFLKHDSQAEINACDQSFTIVECFDSTKLTVKAKDDCKVLINVYGNACVKEEQNGNSMVKIVKKHSLSADK